MIVMIDNYDSFTYNLVQYIEEIGTRVKVVRNDAVSLKELALFEPSGLVISPGPGGPETAGLSVPAIKFFSGKIPVLGVCLGHQSIAVAFGGDIVSARHIMHGKTSDIISDGKGVYKGIEKKFSAMRYHSLSVSRASLPECLLISSEADDGEIMGIRHKDHLTEGIQFHPESIMTRSGMKLLENFIDLV